MTAIFKREFRDYFRGMFGWMIVAVLALAEGIITTVVNLLSTSAELSYVFASLPEVLIVVVPLITARTFTRENSTRNARWLDSLPVSAAARLLGKYLAALLLFLIPTALLAVVPPILANFGEVSYGSAYVSLLGYALLGAAQLALCALLASAVKSRVLSVIFNILLCLLVYLSSLVATVFSLLPLVAFLVCVAAFVGIGVYRGVRYKKLLPAILIAVVPSAILTAVYFLYPYFYERLLPDLISYLGIFDRLAGFRAGHFDLPATVFYLSVVVLCLFFTVRMPNKAAWKGGNRA